MVNEKNCPYAPCGENVNCPGCKYDPKNRKADLEAIEDNIYFLGCSTCDKRKDCNMRVDVSMESTNNARKEYSPNPEMSPYLFNHWDSTTYPEALKKFRGSSEHPVGVTIYGYKEKVYLLKTSDVFNKKLTPETVKELCFAYETKDADGNSEIHIINRGE